MTIDIFSSGAELKSKLATGMAPVVGNPLTTAIFITICIIVIILLVYTGDGIGIGKVAFWSILIITSLIFLHDSILVNDTKHIIGAKEQRYVTIDTPPALCNSTLHNTEKNYPQKRKLKPPTLSVLHMGI